MTETQLHAQCYQWYHNQFRFTEWIGMLHHNDNNSYNAIEGNRKKTMGVIPGTSDFELIGYGWVDFIEMKIPGGTQSADQREFQRKVEARGHRYTILFSFVEFQRHIIKRITDG